MKYFIIPDQENDYQIMKVQTEDVEGFRRRYAGKIIAEGESIAELIAPICGEARKAAGITVCRSEKEAALPEGNQPSDRICGGDNP